MAAGRTRAKNINKEQEQKSFDKISSRTFYQEYHGHPTRQLRKLLFTLRSTPTINRLIWTAGDSSLDNKYWFRDTAPAVGPAYAALLEPPISKQDVTYWLNYHLQQQANLTTAAINCAVEATTINERTFRLRPQDVLIRDNLSPQDILVVSVGGNDIALAPTPCTIASVLGMLFCCGRLTTSNASCTCGTCPIDDYCCGCGPSLASCACAFPPCLGYLRHLFGTRVELYLKALTAKTKPAMILVCMIYYPDEANEPSWAGAALGALGYNSNPARVQSLIRTIYNQVITQINVPGCQNVIPVPLFQVLDGKNPQDYVARVEPSATGGSKMAEFILNIIQQHDNNRSNASASLLHIPPTPSSALIQERE